MRVLSALLIAVGLLLTAAGGAAAVVDGSDDVLETPTSRVDVGDAAAVTTSAGLFAFRGATMHLSASSPDGAVFVGRAHPVDVASWLGSAPRWVITRVDQDGVGGEGVPGGEEPAAPAAPADLDLWADTDTGPGESTVAVTLDGSPTQVVVVPPKGSSALDLRMGIAVPAGAFALALGLLAGGLLLIAVGVLLLVRRRRRGRAAAEAPAPGAAAPRGAFRPAAGRRSGLLPSSAPRLRAAAAVLVLPVLLAGCSWVPEATPAWDPATVTKPAMTTDELPRVLAAYDEANNAAIASTSRSRDPKAWISVDDELVLEADQFSTYRGKVAKEKPSTVALEHTPAGLYATEQHTYPLVALAASDVRRTDEAASAEEKATSTALGVWVRESVSAPWKQAATTTLPKGVEPPAAHAPGAESTPSAAERQAVLTAADAVVAYLGGGPTPKTVTPDTVLTDLRLRVRRSRTSTGVTHRLDARYANSSKDQVSPGGVGPRGPHPGRRARRRQPHGARHLRRGRRPLPQLERAVRGGPRAVRRRL